VEVVATIALSPTSEAPYVVTGAVTATPDAIVILAPPARAAPIISQLIRVGSGPSSASIYGSSDVLSPDLVRLLEV
jgi:hypothetical protein